MEPLLYINYLRTIQLATKKDGCRSEYCQLIDDFNFPCRLVKFFMVY